MGKVRTAIKAAFNSNQWTDASQYISIGGASPGFFRGNSLFNTYAAIYRNSLPVRTVVSFLADNVASVPLNVYRRLDADVRESLDDHGLAKTLKDPNPEETTHEWVRDLVTDLLLFDSYFAKKIRVGNELILVRCYPDAMLPIGGNSLAPEIWREQQVDGSYKDYKRSDIFWLHGYGSFRGVSPMETLRREMQLDQAETDYRLAASKQGWRTAGVIERPKTAGQWTDSARTNFLEGISSRYSGDGAQAGRPLLLEEDMHWTSDASKDGSAEFIAARMLTLKMACFAFQMAPQILGIEGAPYSSILEYKNQLYQGILANKLDFLEQGIEKQLLPEFKDTDKVYVEFNIASKLRGDPTSQAAIAQGAVGTPYITVNEWRAKVWNLGPIDGGNLLMGQMPPGPAPTPGAGGPPKPSDKKLTPPSLPGAGTVKKAVIPADDIEHIKDGFKRSTEKALASVFDKMRVEYQSTGELSRKKWTKTLAGEIQLASMGVTKAVGTFAADRIGSEYSAADTVNYLSKAADEQAKNTLAGLEVALKAEDPMDVFGHAQMQIGRVSATLVNKFAGWAIMELARQSGVSA